MDEAGEGEAGPGDTPSLADLNRLRWRCRRGMLELDLVLARFLAEHEADLTPAQWREFEALLDLEDQALWQRLGTDQAAGSEVERLLRDCAG